MTDFADIPTFVPSKSLDVVDSHTCGQPTRVILDGTAIAAGTSPQDARIFLAETADWVRRIAVLEPRGHRSMFAAALIAPARDGDPYGVAFMDAHGYPDMCGHATIGVATTLCELGLVGPSDPGFDGRFGFNLRTPAGLLELEATIMRGRCEAVTFRTPLACYLGSVFLDLGTGSNVQVDVAYGGQYYAFLPATAVGLTIVPDAIDALILGAVSVRAALARRFDFIDPRIGMVPDIGNIVWTEVPQDKEVHARNVPVSKSGSFDRSPCGTATCARMAVLVAQGKLGIGDAFINESILGTRYRGMAVAQHPEVVHGIVPEVQGSAWLTARSRLILDPRDPLGLGYLIGGGTAVF